MQKPSVIGATNGFITQTKVTKLPMSNTPVNTPPEKAATVEAIQAPDFLISTSPEMEALERAAADGAHRRFYKDDEQAGVRYHAVPGASHSVVLQVSEDERLAGVQLAILENLTDAQDADSALAFLYISRLLAPPSPLPANATAAGKIEFDDVIAKIGWDPRSTSDRRAMHKRLHDFVRFGERAQVMGARRGKYKDKHSGEVIETEIRASLWRIMTVELPEQGSLYPEMEVPLNVTLAINPAWVKLLTSPQTAQYLPLGEKLGAIPGNKPSGAWARVIGLSLASFWRRLPRESLDGSIKPTRRELLERYTPKTGSVHDVLKSNNPQDAITFWCGAIQLLVKAGFVEPTGEALLSSKEIRSSVPRREWGNIWLDAKVDLQPASVMRDSIKQRAVALPAPKPRRRGRPRKDAE